MEKQIEYSLEKYYGIQMERIEQFRHLWRVHSPVGVFVVKAYPNGAQLIEWQNYLFQELRRKGFDQFCPIVLNQYGASWFGDENHPFVVMPYLEGKVARYSKKEDIEKVIRLLANFHHHGAWIGEEILPKYRKVRTYRLFKRLQEFDELYQMIRMKQERDELDEEILAIGRHMLHFGREAFTSIDQSKVNRLHQEAIDYRFVSHRDVANHNFLLGEKSWMIDFDLSAYEPQVMDLWQLTNRIMVDWKWDLKTFLQVEANYHQVRKLTDDERIVFRQLSLYPNEFFRESLGAYYRPDKYKREQVLPYLRRFHQDFEVYDSFRKKVLKG